MICEFQASVSFESHFLTHIGDIFMSTEKVGLYYDKRMKQPWVVRWKGEVLQERFHEDLLDARSFSVEDPTVPSAYQLSTAHPFRFCTQRLSRKEKLALRPYTIVNPLQRFDLRLGEAF